MAHREVLIEFFARYPSALGTTHAGGQYRLICPQCGDMVPVAVLSDDAQQIDVICYNCGFEDHLADGIEANGVNVASSRANGPTPAFGGLGATPGGHQVDRAQNALSA